jgi:myosin heavy subunit
MRGETVTRHFSKEQSGDVRDAAAKEIYVRLFDYIVFKINRLLMPGAAPAEKGRLSIGILDIFGFETFESNGFEQVRTRIWGGGGGGGRAD